MSLSNPEFRTERFSSPGRCIYCDRRDLLLSREHIIPAGIKGHMVLPAASCESCSKLTSQAEMHVLRDWWGVLRGTNGIYSARRKDSRKSTVTALVQGNDATEIVDIPFEAMPAIYPVLRMPPPGIVRGISSPTSPEMQLDLCTVQPDFKVRMVALDATSVQMQADLAPGRLWAMLAKIAHGYTVAVLGLDSFLPLVRRLCLGEEERPWDYVGGEWIEFESRTNYLHFVELRQDGDLLLCRVQLFSAFHSAPYVVAVGRAK